VLVAEHSSPKSLSGLKAQCSLLSLTLKLKNILRKAKY